MSFPFSNEHREVSGRAGTSAMYGAVAIVDTKEGAKKM